VWIEIGSGRRQTIMDIKRLLNKKSWTGRELGIIELTNMAVMFKQVLQGENPKPIIDIPQFKKMINDMKDPVQGQAYNNYIAIHEWLRHKYNIAQTHMQQAQLQYRTLESFITSALLAEDIYSYMEQLPAIMTQKQYDETRAEAESDIQTFNGNKRALLNGVAIVRPSDSLDNSSRIDEHGYYIEPKLQSSLENYSLEAFFPESEDYATNADIMESSREIFLGSYYFIMSYNYVIDRIADIYDVPELDVFKMEIEGLSSRMDTYNDLIPVLYTRIKDTDYNDKELQAKKLQVVKDYFLPVEYKSLVIPEDCKAQIEELLKDFKAFKPENSDRFYTLLCQRPVEDREGA
jgi:hypothetical protein